MRTSALFGAKNFGFFESYGTSAGTKGEGSWASSNILRTIEEGINFSRFFYGRPLTNF